ncbi:hypothetical protein SUDANB6_01663 [Streptomyces sp. enrichment culture]
MRPDRGAGPYDETVTARSFSGSRPAGRLFALLVLAVLAGVLGMHALSPSPVTAAHPGSGHATVMAHADSDSAVVGECSHAAGGAGHLGHADGTCAATGIGSPYTPPALSAAFTDLPAAAARHGGTPASSVSGRAPPDLSELQLLRI